VVFSPLSSISSHWHGPRSSTSVYTQGPFSSWLFGMHRIPPPEDYQGLAFVCSKDTSYVHICRTCIYSRILLTALYDGYYGVGRSSQLVQSSDFAVYLQCLSPSCVRTGFCIE